MSRSEPNGDYVEEQLGIDWVADDQDVFAFVDVLAAGELAHQHLLTDGRAVLSKVSNDFSVGNFAAFRRLSPARRSRSRSSSSASANR